MMEMQINGLNGVSAYNPYTPKNTSSQMKNVTLPKYGFGVGLIATKTETDRTDEEIKNDVIELAKQDARRGIHGMDIGGRGAFSAEYFKLSGEYFQSVSPDRRSIYPAGIAQMGKATTLRGFTPTIDTSLLDLMLNGTKINLKNTGVIYDKNSKQMEINHVEFFIGRECIGWYDMGRGWGFQFSNEERSRFQEINSIYTKAWKDERKAMGMGK
jgi:hypothetical protein